MSRLSPLDLTQLSPSQKEVYDRMTGGPRGALTGPFPIILRSVDLTTRIEKFGDYIRFECGLPERLKKIAILVVARHWRSDFEWQMHAPGAAKLGISSAVIAAIGSCEAPVFDDDADRSVYNYASELLATGRVTDVTFAVAKGIVGEMGVIDLPALIGFYGLLALLMNSLEVPGNGAIALPWTQPL